VLKCEFEIHTFPHAEVLVCLRFSGSWTIEGRLRNEKGKKGQKYQLVPSLCLSDSLHESFSSEFPPSGSLSWIDPSSSCSEVSAGGLDSMHGQCPFPLAFQETTAGGEDWGEDRGLASLWLLTLFLTC